MKIPEIRSRLLILAEKYDSLELRFLALELTRRRNTIPAEPRCNPMTAELREKIIQYATENPDLSQLEIGNHFGVNPGRVSETLYGFRN